LNADQGFGSKETPNIGKTYAPHTLAALTAFLEQASGAVPSRSARLGDGLATALTDLFDAVLGPQDDIIGELWKDLGTRDLPHGDLASLFAEAADASDPFAIVTLDSFAFAELKSSLRTFWASAARRDGGQPVPLDAAARRSLTGSQQDDVRDRIRNLARFHRSFISAGASLNNPLNTILFELATLFVTHADLDIHEYELPHAPTSYFIQFAALATQPYFAPGAVTPAGLSNRWKRQKQTHHSTTP
jgi:hypothetical protein